MAKMTSGLVRALIVLAMFVSVATSTLVLSSDRAVAQVGPPTALNVAIQQDIPDFNIWNLASNSIWKSKVLNWGFEGLVGLDYDMLPFGVLAESWTFDSGSLTWTFNLRTGVTFHDGSPFTADDVVFMYAAVREGTTYSWQIISAFDSNFDGVVSQAEINAAVWKEDNYTVKMMMASPYGQFLSTTAQVPILPKHIWQDHLTYDGLVDVLWNDPAAVIGTGPWMYAGGVAGVSRTMEKYTDYWGTSTTTPLGYKMYPQNIDEIFFEVYTSTDSAASALQGGAVDFVSWPITASWIPVLGADPSVELAYLSDNGYFYLAFNEKLDPMGSLAFRQAVSYVIDKDQIVNVYMGGYGVKGSACEPPFWGEWFNESVARYPFDSTFSIPNAMLNASGFAIDSVSGWRMNPDGTPMEKITILTPPADYDPVRIRAGEMIAKNMREGLHINAEALAIDFTTLVTKLQAMDYQMLIIGWSLGSEPVSNVFDILGPKSNSNTFGFWSVSDPNPFYKDLLGVNTLADAETQALAVEVDRLAGLAKTSFDVTDQIKYTKWGEGVLAEAVPVNVLYYKINAVAWRAVWINWLPYLGDIFNRFSLSQLSYSGPPVGIIEAYGPVTAALTLQEKVGVGDTAHALVKVIDSGGLAVADASVAVTVEGLGGSPASVVSDPISGATDASGIFGFNVTGISGGYSYVNVSVSKESVTSLASSVIQSVNRYSATLALHVSPEKLVLSPGDTCLVHLNVTDEMGTMVPGATIAIDPNLIAYGTVDNLLVVTDALGTADVTYIAPAVIPELNAHLETTLSFSVSKTGYAWTDDAAVNLLIYNADPPDWIMTQVTGVSPTYLYSGSNLTTIDLLVTDDEGNPLGKHIVNVVYSNESVVFGPVKSVETTGAGTASFDVQFKAGMPSMCLRVTASDTSVPNSVPATVTLTYADGGTAPTMYGGYMTWDLPAPFMGPLGAITATAHVWDQLGGDADGIDASLIVGGTVYGSLAWCDLVNWDSIWDGWGINIVTAYDSSNLVTSGPFNTPYDYADWEFWYNMGYIYWDWGTMTGVQIFGGTLDIMVYGMDVAPIDLIGSIYLVPDGYGTFDSLTLNYRIDGPSVITADYVMGRSYSVVAPSYNIIDPVLEARNSSYDETNVLIWVTDESGLPVQDASAIVYERSLTGNTNYMVVPYASSSSKWRSASVLTGADGFANESIVAIGKNYYVTSSSIEADVYVRASSYGAISMFSQSRVFIQTQKCFVEITPIIDPVAVGDIVDIETTVMDFSGAPISGVSVTLDPGGGDVLGSAVNTTDLSGHARFRLDTSNVTGASAGFIVVRAIAGGTGFETATAVAMVPFNTVDNVPPVAEAGSDVWVLGGEVVTFNGSGSSDNVGIVSYTWTFVYDNETVVLTGVDASFLFEINGVYEVTLTVTDAMNNSASDTMYVVVSGYIPEFPTVLIPIAGIAVLLLIGRARRKRIGQ